MGMGKVLLLCVLVVSRGSWDETEGGEKEGVAPRQLASPLARLHSPCSPNISPDHAHGVSIYAHDCTPWALFRESGKQL